MIAATLLSAEDHLLIWQRYRLQLPGRIEIALCCPISFNKFTGIDMLLAVHRKLFELKRNCPFLILCSHVHIHVWVLNIVAQQFLFQVHL